MSYTNCIRTIAQAAGRTLSDEEVLAIYTRVHKAALDIKAGRASAADIAAGKKVSAIPGATDDIIRAAAERAAADLMHEAQVEQRQAHLQVVKLAGAVDGWKRLTDAGMKPVDAVRALITRDYTGKINVESIEQRVAGHKSYFGRKLLDSWDSLGKDYLGFFQDRDKLRALITELRGEDSGDALAKRGAKAFHETAEEARQTFNAAGGDIGKLDDWGMPQHHSQERVAAAGRDAWVDSILPMLDRSRYVDDLGNAWSDVDLRTFLGKAWDTIATDGLANVVPGKMMGTGKMANRHGEHRQIHFASADDVISYWEKFGERTPVEILSGHVDTMARDIAFVEAFGPNPNTTYKTLRDMAVQQMATDDPTKTGAAQTAGSKLDKAWNYWSGKSSSIGNLTLKKTADAIANLNTAGKLGGAALASLFGDKPMMEAVAHLNNLPAFKRWQTELALLNPANKSDRRQLQRQGLMLESIRSGLQRWGDDLGTTSATSMLANAVMRVTGMQAINDIRKGSFGISLMGAIGDEIKAGRDFASLPDSDVRALRNYGITEADWRVWKLAQLDDMGRGNDAVLTPDSIARIPDAELAKALDPEIRIAQEGIGTKIAELTERNLQEGERFQKRLAEIQKAENDAAQRLNRFMTTRDSRIKGAGEYVSAQKDLLRARVERAEAQADIDAYLAAERQQGSIKKIVSEISSGKDLDAAEAIGERAGRKIGDLERTIAEKEKRLAELVRGMDRDTSARFVELNDRLNSLADRAVSDRGDIDGRIARLEKVENDLAQTLNSFITRNESVLASKSDAVDAARSLAEYKIDMAKSKAEQELALLKAQRIDRGEAMGERVDRNVQSASRVRGSIGERLGRKVGSTERRIVELETKLRTMEQSADAEVRAKYEELRGDVQKVIDRADEWYAQSAKRVERRGFVIDRLSGEASDAQTKVVEEARRNAIVKLLGAVNTESEFAIVTPGWRERAQFYSGLAGERGTVMGEVARSILQFKAFPWAMFQRSLDAVANSDGPVGKAGMTAYVLVATTLAGAMLMQTRDMLSGKDPREMFGDRDWFKFWGAAFLQGGALGIYGDFLYGANQTRYGSGPIEALAGPTVGPLMELGLVQPMKAIKDTIEGKESHFLAKQFQDLKGFVPGGNIWYLKAALDHMVFQQVLEMLSPGYLASIRSRTLKDYQQDWYYMPGDFTPERFPDLGKAFGQ